MAQVAKSQTALGSLWLCGLLVCTLGGGTTLANDSSTSEPRASAHWVATWMAVPQPALPGTVEKFHGQTLRLIVHSSAGGPRARIRLSNRYGQSPVAIGAATLARRTEGPGVDAASLHTITFHGQRSVLLAAGASVVSDAIDEVIPPLTDLAISLHLSSRTTLESSHILAQQTSYVGAPGSDLSRAATFTPVKTLDSWPLIARLDVNASPPSRAIVVFGDSRVDGDGSTSDANTRWSDALARRLGAVGLTDVAVLNAGLIGNRLLRGSPEKSRKLFGEALGQAGILRFGNDALEQPGVKFAVLCAGVNDIGFPGAFASEDEQQSAASILAGLEELAHQGHRRGVKVIATTIAPFEGAAVNPAYWSAAKERLRQEVNDQLRRSHEFDAVIDLDRVLADPAHPSRLAAGLDSGDHLHPNDAGYQAMAETIPLELFRSG